MTSPTQTVQAFLDAFARHDVDAALAEVRRVLRPGGSLRFVEHGLAPDERVRRWQRRLEPLQKRLFGGCHLTRPVAGMLTAAGFTVTTGLPWKLTPAVWPWRSTSPRSSSSNAAISVGSACSPLSPRANAR